MISSLYPRPAALQFVNDFRLPVWIKENELHQHFKEHRLNRINGKKEFFRISLDDIEKFVLQHTGATISFTKAAEAREYRETMTLLEQLKARIDDSQVIEKFPAKLTA